MVEQWLEAPPVQVRVLLRSHEAVIYTRSIRVPDGENFSLYKSLSLQITLNTASKNFPGREDKGI